MTGPDMSFLDEQVSAAKLEHFHAALFDDIDAQFGEGGTGEKPAPPETLRVDIHSSLTLASPTGHNSSCCNARDRRGMWARDDPNALESLVSPSAGFPNQLAQLCVSAEIHECSNDKCLNTKRSMQKLAPKCAWDSFRNWAIVAMSCQACFSDEQRLTRAHTHIATAVSLQNTLLAWYKNKGLGLDNELIGSWRAEIDLAQVCDVIYWMLTIQASRAVGNVVEGKWGPEFIPEQVVQESAEKALELSKQSGLCLKRMNSLALVSERKEADLAALVEAAQKHPNLKHTGHHVCTTDACKWAEIDSTKVEQLHKCKARSTCTKYKFQADIVEHAVWSGESTAWSLDRTRTLSPGERYAAISHVWSDGTGVGVEWGNDKDKVNTCLYDYLASVVANERCDGIWWDTISLPMEPDARKKAISNMHLNYASAVCTVVHDRYLLDVEWREDGTPCLALVLSPWFTRGWTALELAKSNTVKVLFKGDHPNRPIVKDLEKHILAVDPARSSRAHWIASSLIRRLRKPVTDVSDILTILGPRGTSWERDRKLIAALLAEWDGVSVDKTEGDHTRGIISLIGKMGMACLFHGYETMATSGPFSWCPLALRDMPSQAIGDLREGPATNTTLSVDSQGVVKGSFYYRLVTRADTRRGVLVQHHAVLKNPRTEYAEEQGISKPPTASRLRDALRSFQNCILLRDHWQSTGPALLVATVGRDPGMGSNNDTIDCSYIVSVFDNSPRPSRRYDSRYKSGTVTLGNDQGRKWVAAAPLLGLGAEDSSGPEFDPETDEEEGVDTDDIPEDGVDGWISSDSNGPRRPASMFGPSKPKQKKSEKRRVEADDEDDEEEEEEEDDEEEEEDEELSEIQKKLAELMAKEKKLKDRKRAKLEKERLEYERLEKERLEKEKQEKERLERERLERERLERERLERERLERERLERERAAAQYYYTPPAPAQAIVRRYSCCRQEYISCYASCGCGRNGMPVPHLGEAMFGAARCYDPSCSEHSGGRNRTYLPRW